MYGWGARVWKEAGIGEEKMKKDKGQSFDMRRAIGIIASEGSQDETNAWLVGQM
jgi:hypothetical protein